MIRMPPPHILYPGMVLALLTLSMTSSFSILYFAKSGGGPQVESGYYERTVSWDADQKARDSGARLGWTVDLQLSGSLQVRDAQGSPVSGIVGTVVTRRPSLGEAVATSALTAVGGSPGAYAFESGANGVGLWDFMIVAVAPSGEPVILELRREARE
ncbi:MAG: FixH family protein [Bradymonadaceae bacterium]|nr:FixH family protein [Lujinxingiaceae bacterium]